MPRDVNTNADIFSGWALVFRWTVAAALPQVKAGDATTVALGAMKFIRPVRVGMLVHLWSRGAAGLPSMDRHRGREGAGLRPRKAPEAVFTLYIG
jgi:acyl-CoA thioesterase YciA